MPLFGKQATRSAGPVPLAISLNAAARALSVLALEGLLEAGTSSL